MKVIQVSGCSWHDWGAPGYAALYAFNSGGETKIAVDFIIPRLRILSYDEKTENNTIDSVITLAVTECVQPRS